MAGKSGHEPSDRAEVAAILVAARRARHRAAREATKARKARAAELRRDGQTERAAALEAKIDRRNYALIRFRRRQEERELEKFWRPIRVRIEEGKRPRFRMNCPANLYSRFEYGTGGVGQMNADKPQREVFLQWVGRGFKSGRRCGSRSSSRTGRNRAWRPGEAGRMVRYICRADALEFPAAGIFSNVGETIEELVSFFRELEKVEEQSRSDASVYHHGIIALPYDIVPEERLAAMQEVLRPLRDLRLGHVAAIHKPDADGDQRNIHLHIVLSLRPMRRTGEFEWELDPTKKAWLDTPAGLLLMRRHLARTFNRALARSGSTARWTHLSRADRGLVSPGNTKRSPGDRHLKAVENAEAMLRQAREQQGGIERARQVVETLENTVDRISCQRDKLAELAAAATSRMRDLHRQLLELSERAAHAKRRLIKVRAMALRRLREMRLEAEDIANAAAVQRADVGRQVEQAAQLSSRSSMPPAPAQMTSLDRLKEMRRRAEDLYPEPGLANHRSVRSLLAALRTVQSPETLRELAAEVAKDPRAVAELRTFGPKVVEEYDTLVRQGHGTASSPSQLGMPPRPSPGYER